MEVTIHPQYVGMSATSAYRYVSQYSTTWTVSVPNTDLHIPFDNHMSMHRNRIPNYSQQDATFFYLFIFTDALHVSGGSSAHHQEHI